jgi:nitrogen fixation NifU-like protein
MEGDDDIKKIMESLLLGKMGNLYSERVIDYGSRPRNCGTLDRPDGYAKVTGPCGDTVEIFLHIRDGRIREIRYTTDGCMTSHAAGFGGHRNGQGKGSPRLPEDQREHDTGSSRGSAGRFQALCASGSDHIA